MDDNKQLPRSHPRPFFYVQPASQPYYLCPPWQMNQPFGPLALPGGLGYGRPCLHPYQYLQYPGLMYPQAPVFPLDYRRMFEPRLHPPVWGDVPRHHHQQQQQQQHHHHPPPQGRRETACSEVQTDPGDAISKLIECLDKLRGGEAPGAERELDSGVASQSSGLFSPAEEKKKEEQGEAALRPLQPDPEASAPEIPEIPEEDPPLRGSSPHGDLAEQRPPDVTDERSEVLPEPRDARCPAGGGVKRGAALSQASASDEADPSCRILKLPFEQVFAPGASAGGLSSRASYYYNYLPVQSTHERLSVLSPSLDELSSRDEMFSTDLDDVELFPKHVASGRRLSEEVAGAEDDLWAVSSRRFLCVCCGKSLAAGGGRSRAHGGRTPPRDAADSEDDGDGGGKYGRAGEPPVRLVVRKHSTPRRTWAAGRQPWSRRAQRKDPPDPVLPDQGRHPAEGEVELQCRTCQDGHPREDVAAPDPGRRGDGAAVPRRRPATPLHLQEMNSLRKAALPRQRDDHDEASPPHWERGSTLREPRC